MEDMSSFEKVVMGIFGVFTVVLTVNAVSHHREEIVRWTDKKIEPLKRGVRLVRKYRQGRRAQKVASEM